MADDTITESIPAAAEAVFALLHDYDRRLEWDTLLRAAYLEPGFPRAALGAVSVCVAKRWLGGMAVRTRYTTFQPGRLAAVKMLNSPAFFARFAASIRHTPTGPDSSLATLPLHFPGQAAGLGLRAPPDHGVDAAPGNHPAAAGVAGALRRRFPAWGTPTANRLINPRMSFWQKRIDRKWLLLKGQP